MANAIQDTKALVVVSQDQMLEKLQNSERMLDDINRGLNDYLEKKRLFFPRSVRMYCKESPSYYELIDYYPVVY